MPDALSTATTTTRFDDGKADAFMNRMVGAFNESALVLMTSIGHKTGLFECLKGQPPATSHHIARRAGLDERYVREWLAALVTARVMAYDPATATYHLPDEHAALLTRGGPTNLAITAQLLPAVVHAESRVVECFRNGGGTDYADYPCFHSVMAEDSGQTVVDHLFSDILPLVPGLLPALEDGIDVMDAGCGQGRALLAMAERFPASRFTGYDLCADAVARGNAMARERGLRNVTFAWKDLTGFVEPDRYDLITTFDAVHDQKDPAGLLRGISRSLKPGGTYLMQDIGGSSHLERNLDHPFATLLYSISLLHCMPVSLGQGGDGLGTMWGVELAETMLRQAGFHHIALHRLAHDPLNIYAVCRTDMLMA